VYDDVTILVRLGLDFTGKMFLSLLFVIGLFILSFGFAGVGLVGLPTVLSYGDGGEGAGGADGGCGSGSRRHLLPATEGEINIKDTPDWSISTSHTIF